VAVRRRLGHVVGPDAAARPRAALDDKRLAEVPAERVGQDARDRLDAAARREGNHDPHRLRRVALGRRGQRSGQHAERGPGDHHQAFQAHRFLLVRFSGRLSGGAGVVVLNAPPYDAGGHDPTDPREDDMLTRIARLAAAGLAIWTGFAAEVAAQSYPEKPVRIVVPFAPGGRVEGIARLLAQSLSAQLGQPFVVESRAGAGGGIGSDFVAKSPKDGYTLLLVSAGTHAILPNVDKALPYESVRDFTPIANLVEGFTFLGAHPSSAPRRWPNLSGWRSKSPGRSASPPRGSAPTATSRANF
jgi:hypothetical protein